MKSKFGKREKVKKMQKGKAESKKDKVDMEELMAGSDSELDDDAGLIGATKMSQTDYLQKLKDSDPEFYKAMMTSDDLAMQSDSDESQEKMEQDQNESSDEEDEDEKQVFKPPKDLAEQSDEEDSGEEEMNMSDGENTKGSLMNAAVLQSLKSSLEDPNPLNAFRDLEQALLAAIESLGGHDADKTVSKYKIEGPQMFNAVVRLSLQQAAPTLQKIFHLKNIDDDPSKSKKWGKLKNFVKPYLRHMVKLTEAIAEPEVAVVLLKKGILPILSYYSAHPNAGKLLVRRLITLWATSHQRVRVLAYIAIFRLVQSLKTELLDDVLKKMYLAYVQNCRFTTPSSWGMIDFMRVSLVELYAMDKNITYRQAFLYIRQMAFHLRNAILTNKKEKIQMVYNWQYIHCLHLWAALLSRTHPDAILQPLIYPLTQIAVGTMKLQASAKFYPLMFHICSILTDLSSHTDTFIPILPFLLQVLNGGNLNKKHKKSSIKPFPWICMLKLSKSQLVESAFKDGVIEQFYNETLKYLNVEAASIAFPDLVVPAICQLKDFIKTCKNPNYTKKIKQLLEKVNENSKFISDRRKNVRFNIADEKAVKDWEIEVRQTGTPITNYYKTWSASHKKNILKQISNKIELDNYDLPVMKKKTKTTENKKETTFDNAFDSEEDSDNDEDQFLTKKRKLESESDNEDDSENDNPPTKKAKGSTKALDDDLNSDGEDEESDEGLDIDGDDSTDVVREMNLSDLEDEEEEDDEFDEEEGSGEESDEDEDE